MPYLDTFGLEFQKTTDEISTFEFFYLQNLARKQKWLNFKTRRANFDIRSTFSKSPGSTFSEGLSPWSGSTLQSIP